MKISLFLLFLPFLLFGNESIKVPHSKYCSVMYAWQRNGKYKTGKEICEKMGGFNCAKADSIGKGICIGSKVGSCSQADSIGEGICRSLKLGSCAFYNEKTAIKKLKEACPNHWRTNENWK